MSSDYKGFAGANPSLVVVDELWGVTKEAGRRLWTEAVPVPTRKVSGRLVTTYAGFTGESTLLERVFERAMRGTEVAPDLYAQPGMLAFWGHGQYAPWITKEWIEEARASMLPNEFDRVVMNRWVNAEDVFISSDLIRRATVLEQPDE
jgi:hypothetical protein